MSLPTCPKCGCQLDIKITYAAGPKSDNPPSKGLSRVAEWLEEAEDRTLDAWQSEFVGSLRERYDKYGDRVKLSDKQLEILQRIAEGKSR